MPYLRNNMQMVHRWSASLSEPVANEESDPSMSVLHMSHVSKASVASPCAAGEEARLQSTIVLSQVLFPALRRGQLPRVPGPRRLNSSVTQQTMMIWCRQ